MFKSVINAFIKYNLTCIHGNSCAAVSLLLTRVICSLFSVIILLVYRGSKNCFCLNFSGKIISNMKYDKKIMRRSSIMLWFCIVWVFLRMLFNIFFWDVKKPLIHYLFYFSYIIPTIVQNILSVFCCIAEQAFLDINNEIKYLTTLQYSAEIFIPQIKKLKARHFLITEYVKKISECFGMDILLGILDHFIELVAFLYLYFWTMVVEEVFPKDVMPHFTAISEILFITCKLAYFCYCCNRVITTVSKQ